MKNTLTIPSLPLQVRWEWGASPKPSLVGCLSDPKGHDHLVVDRSLRLIWDTHAQTPAHVEKEGRFLYLYGAFHYPLPGIYQPLIGVDDEEIPLNTRIIVGDAQQRWVSSVLHSTLGAAPSQADFRYYDHLLKKGLSHNQVVQELLHSGDWLKKQVEICYRTILDRHPTTEETRLGIGTIQKTGSVSGLQKSLYLTDEFSPDGSTGFIDALVENAVGDAALRPNLRHQLQQQLENGQSKSQLTTLALQSTPVALSLIDGYRSLLTSGDTTAVQISDALSLWQQKDGEQALLQHILTRPRVRHSYTQEPDIIIQLFDASLVSQAEQATFEEHLQQISGALQTDLNMTFPGADVVPMPDAQLIPSDNELNGGIWFNAPGMLEEELELLEVDIPLPQSEKALFAIQFVASSIITAMDKFWQAAPKRRDSNGDVDADHGSIHLTSYSLEMANKTVILKIMAYAAARAGLKIPITVTYKDVLSLDNNGHIQVQSSSSIDIHDFTAEALEALGFIFVPGIFDSLPLEFFNSDLQGREAGAKAPVFPTLGALLQQNFTVLILVPGTKDKIDFQYDFMSLDAINGFVVAGSQDPLTKRNPVVTITGKRYVFENDPTVTWKSTGKPGTVGAQLTYGLITQDMRPPLTVEWTIAGVDVPGNTAANNSVTTLFQFTLDTDQTKQISAQVTDDDGQVVTAYFQTTYLGTQQITIPPKAPHQGIITTQTIPVG